MSPAHFFKIVSIAVKNKHLGVRLGFTSWLCYLLFVAPYMRYVKSLASVFSSVRWEIMISNTQNLQRDQMYDLHTKCYVQSLTHQPPVKLIHYYFYYIVLIIIYPLLFSLFCITIIIKFPNEEDLGKLPISIINFWIDSGKLPPQTL